jgi:hypothetical protein
MVPMLFEPLATGKSSIETALSTSETVKRNRFKGIVERILRGRDVAAHLSICVFFH